MWRLVASGMKPRAVLLPLSAVVLAVALSACAPGATGTSAAAPYDLSAGDVSAKPGETIYLRATYTLDDFGLKPSDLSSWMWVPAGYNRDAAVMTTNFELTGVEAPAGWSLTLQEVRAYRRTVEGQRSFDPAAVEHGLTVTYGVSVPPGAFSGPYRIRAQLTRRTNSVPIEVQVKVGG